MSGIPFLPGYSSVLSGGSWGLILVSLEGVIGLVVARSCPPIPGLVSSKEGTPFLNVKACGLEWFVL